MRKFILVSLIAMTAAGPLSTPSFAQQAESRGGSERSESRSSERGDFFVGITHQRRRPILISADGSGAFCVIDKVRRKGEKLSAFNRRVRLCEDRTHIEVK